MLKAYFVSDLHLNAPDSPRAELFVAFLQALEGSKNVSHLFLMGDIFDLWVADHACFVERYRSIVDEVRRLREEGVEVHYFEGNHDLHLRGFWADQLGVQVHEELAYVQLGGRTLRLEHGDQMNPDDRGYLFLRWFLRTPPIRFLVSSLPGDLILRLGEGASSSSREYTSTAKSISQNDAIATIRDHARRASEDRRFDVIISGHVHVRDDFTFSDGAGSFRSINLGSWLDRPCCFLMDDRGDRFIELSMDGLLELQPTAAEAAS